MSIYDAVSRYASPCERCGSVQFMHHKYSTQCDLDYIRKLEKENEELKEKNKYLNKEALYWKNAMIDLEINREEQSK